jgi:hypothetical protein
LINGRHYTVRHQFFDDLNGAFSDLLGKITNDNTGRKLDLMSVFAHKPPPKKLQMRRANCIFAGEVL